MKWTNLLQIAGRPWLVDEQYAYQYAEVFNRFLAGENISMKVVAGNNSGDDDDSPKVVDANGNTTTNGNVLLMCMDGPLMKQDLCGEPGTATMCTWIDQLNNNPNLIAGVIVSDSPGGTVDGTETFANKVLSSKKPIVCFADLACSAAYWIASGCNEIVLSGETAMVGSVGVMATLTDDTKQQEMRGLKKVTVFASRSSDKNKAHADALAGNTTGLVEQHLDPIQTVFENAVLKNRAGKIDLKKEDIGTGKVYTGKQAINVGLADKIGTLDFAIKRAIQLAKTIN